MRQSVVNVIVFFWVPLFILVGYYSSDVIMTLVCYLSGVFSMKLILYLIAKKK